MSIKEFYLETYSTDEYGFDIKENATFTGLLDVLHNSDDVYEYIGVGDSTIRERLFGKLSEILGTSYDYVYNLWLK